MGDGKYYAIEPGGNVIKNRPKHPGYPDIPFIVDEMVVGNTVHHIKKHMVENGDFPYEIRAIMTSDEYEKSCSDFGNFLRIASKRDKETQDKIIKPLEKVLGKINKDGHVGSTEDFCAAVQKLDLPIHIAVVKIGDKRRFQAITITINGDLYYFRHDHSYLMMHRVKDLENNKMEDMDSGKEFMIESQCSPAKYLEIIKSQTHDFANEK